MSNDKPRRGPIALVAIGIWDGMNFVRRLFFNLLFFGLLFLFMLAILIGDRSTPLLDKTVLVIAPKGALVEQYSSDPMSRALAKAFGDDADEVQLRDLVRALDRAASDKRIDRVLLRLDEFAGGGPASMRELAAAIGRVKAAGKQVVGFGENVGQSQYLLLAQANELYLDPMGGLLLEGYGRYRQYFREGLQDKLGVDVHLFKVGEYKSAAEPYVLDAASAESKEADLFWMNDVWQRYLGDIAKARKLNAAQLATGIDQFSAGLAAVQGDLAKYALQQKLVDGLKTREQVEDLLVERGAEDADAEGGFRQVSLEGYLAHIDRASLAAVDRRPKVAVVVAEGEITGGEQPPGTVGGESTAALLREARDDEDVKALVLRVDSPGGEVFASEQIRREIVALKAAGKPVVVSMGDLAASGGYWISMNADRIYADPSTITGSIGIFGLIPTIPRALEKIGVHTDGVGTTRFAGAFDITRPLDPDVGNVIQSVIDKGYRDFTGKVAQARKKPVEQVDAVARGRVWTGAQAKERGLVDELGGLQAAIDDVAARAKLGKTDDYQVRYVEKITPPFARLFGSLAESRMGSAWLRESGMARALLAKAAPQAAADLRFLEGSIQRTQGVPVKSLAYCFCGW
ncbi:signal peptide peptidase SppA [Montanilutibacter psychrotolerans]|uniref:Signal peptide peptidase SppA n=1 Tax=Montanilutibacter psychrotolerans TaxID=1327343 RepID=A0A3M8T049_9GAMM|nr:signal peptide peptidase SppA [Lysobacter psychrotolerans]RNF84510.1 signal peptide peptidase SppA [Lysobacter psychrotolerans]